MTGTPVSTLLGLTGTLYFVILSLFGWRIYQRIRQRHFLWDDYSITLAIVLALFGWALIIAATTLGLGNHTPPHGQNYKAQIHHLIFSSELFWIPTTALARISISFTLLHFKQTRPWRILLSLLIATQAIFSIIDLVFLALQCIPIQFTWDEHKHTPASCSARSTVVAGEYVHAGVSTATDLALTLMALSFPQRAGIPSAENIAIAALVVLGFLATVFSILRLRLLPAYAASRADATTLQITLWAILEAQMALLAANIAALKHIPPKTPRPESQYYIARRRRRARRASSLSRPEDAYPLPPLSLSLSHKRSLGFDTNVSSLPPPLRQMRSEEAVWPRELREGKGEGEWAWERRDSVSPFESVVTRGGLGMGMGILMTTELDVRSETLSRAGSVEEGGGREVMARGDWREV